MCKERTRSPIPNVAKAVKTASAIHPNQDTPTCDGLLRSVLVCISLSTFSHRGNPSVGVSFVRLP
jgi:hypothetical protein